MGGARVRRLIGVYDADGTLAGELRYWVGARVGRAHCALCDITHGLVRERADWRACRDALPVEFVTYHRNDQPEAVRAATGDRAPVVVAETDDRLVVLLDGAALDACSGDPDRLVTAVDDALSSSDLVAG